MNRTYALVLVASTAVVAACNPAPRSASYFEAHPDETARALRECKAGSRRGDECNNAEFAQAKLKSKARLELYKSGFQ